MTRRRLVREGCISYWGVYNDYTSVSLGWVVVKFHLHFLLSLLVRSFICISPTWGWVLFETVSRGIFAPVFSVDLFRPASKRLIPVVLNSISWALVQPTLHHGVPRRERYIVNLDICTTSRTRQRERHFIFSPAEYHQRGAKDPGQATRCSSYQIFIFYALSLC